MESPKEKVEKYLASHKNKINKRVFLEKHKEEIRLLYTSKVSIENIKKYLQDEEGIEVSVSYLHNWIQKQKKKKKQENIKDQKITKEEEKPKQIQKKVKATYNPFDDPNRKQTTDKIIRIQKLKDKISNDKTLTRYDKRQIENEIERLEEELDIIFNKYSCKVK